jgi:hypothetical protein
MALQRAKQAIYVLFAMKFNYFWVLNESSCIFCVSVHPSDKGV